MHSFPLFAFLAQQSHLQKTAQHFREGSQIGSSNGPTFFFVLSLVALSACLAFYFWKYNAREGGFKSHSGLFRELCQIHALDRSEKKVLHQVVRWRHLTQPAQIFLEPTHFEFNSLSPALQQQKHILKHLQEKLYSN